MGGRTYFVTLIFLAQFSTVRSFEFFCVFLKLSSSQLQSDDKITRKLAKITPPVVTAAVKETQAATAVLRFKSNLSVVKIIPTSVGDVDYW